MQPNNRKRKRVAEAPGPSARESYTRTAAACDACRSSKTRCDAARPICAKCAQRGRNCVYPETDPTSVFETWGKRILNAIDGQSHLIANLTSHNQDFVSRPSESLPPPEPCYSTTSDLEATSRKDVPWTPITASDKILDWAVFPRDLPVKTLPSTAYYAKANPWAHETLSPSPERIMELRDIYMAKVELMAPLTDLEYLDGLISEVLQNGFTMSVSSCFVLLILALASIWGNYPNDERRTVTSEDGQEHQTMAIPEERLRESSIYFAMAQQRVSMALVDHTFQGAICYCFMGTWHWYNFEPIQGWKMFRVASMLWEMHYQKRAAGVVEWFRGEQSLEQRLYWICMKAECEMRYEIPQLPLCALQESPFPYSLPSFTGENIFSPSDFSKKQNDTPLAETTLISYYYFLAEISLRRLLNRARHVATGLSTTIDSAAATAIAEKLVELEDQLQQWIECLPACLYFELPPDTFPETEELELVKLTRERYTEVREILCRAFLYICLHGQGLSQDQMMVYGARASYGLRLNVYRIETEKPFWRHAGSWIACRVRFNQALCLLAAARAKDMGLASVQHVYVPNHWYSCVEKVKQRLGIWADQGSGVGELVTILEHLTSDVRLLYPSIQ